MKKSFIIGFLTALALVAVVSILGPIIYVTSNAERIAYEAFSIMGGGDVTLQFKTEERMDLSRFHRASAGEIATALAQGDEKKTEQYLAVLQSGLQIEIEIISHEDNTTTYDSFFYPERRITHTSSTATVTLTSDREPMSLEELMEQIEIEPEIAKD